MRRQLTRQPRVFVRLASTNVDIDGSAYQLGRLPAKTVEDSICVNWDSIWSICTGIVCEIVCLRSMYCERFYGCFSNKTVGL